MRKPCFKCGLEKDLGEFYKHPEMTDGRLNKCKECAKGDVRENRANRRLQYSAYERQRFQRPERKAQMYESARRRRAKYPVKETARHALNNAIRDKKLDREPCEICGEKNAQGHHTDYSKPFEVQWLCFKHHREDAHGQVVVSSYGGM